MKMVVAVLRISLIVISICFLNGCLSAVKTKPEPKFMLSLFPNCPNTCHRRNTTILVLKPDTVVAYNTTGIAYSIAPFEISYYGRSRWVATPSQMLQPLIVQTLQNTNAFRAVVTPPFLGNYDYMLNTQILQVLLDYNCRPPLATIMLRAQLSSAYSGKIIASKEFSFNRPIPRCNPYCGVIAANYATADLLGELASFCIRNTR